MIPNSKRLIFRNPSLEDAQVLLEIYSDVEAMKYRLNPPISNLHESVRMVQEAIEKNEKNLEYRICIVEKKSFNLIRDIID